MIHKCTSKPTLDQRNIHKPFSCTFPFSGLILATYCVKYSHAMPFLRNKMPYWPLKPSKANAI